MFTIQRRRYREGGGEKSKMSALPFCPIKLAYFHGVMGITIMSKGARLSFLFSFYSTGGGRIGASVGCKPVWI